MKEENVSSQLKELHKDLQRYFLKGLGIAITTGVCGVFGGSVGAYGGLLGSSAVAYYSESKRQNGEPLEILKERLAKGEITSEEFEEMKKEIKYEPSR